MKEFTPLEKGLCGIDSVLRTLFAPSERIAGRPNPAQNLPENPMNDNEKKHVAGLMRVNHSGEVCAQALYQGQALTANLSYTKEQMQKAAEEEVDHLAWCEQRLRELNSGPSALNFFWFTQSLLLGALAGLAGDRWSLGFVAETERQVTAHLEDHLKKLPAQDIKTQTILKKMQQEEMHHAEMANKAGAYNLPTPIQGLMTLMSKIMTKSSYYL